VKKVLNIRNFNQLLIHRRKSVEPRNELVHFRLELFRVEIEVEKRVSDVEDLLDRVRIKVDGDGFGLGQAPQDDRRSFEGLLRNAGVLSDSQSFAGHSRET